jgi:Xaa-Pro aminopeptidase
VGLHEHPSISPFDKAPLVPDMVLNIEPIGIDPKAGGFGQELAVHVTENGPRILSDYTDLSRMCVTQR